MKQWLFEFWACIAKRCFLGGFPEKGGHTELFHEKGGQTIFTTKREASGHLFHEKGGQNALWRLVDQFYLRLADN